MRDKIISESIKSLQKEGLKFSVDTIAETLKISKKTVYKYFPSKEALALELYRKYYQEANARVVQLTEEKPDTIFSDLLYLYFDSKKMIQREIFNKYNLNEVIRAYAEDQNDKLWSAVFAVRQKTHSENDSEAIRMIVDGTFEKLCINKTLLPIIIEKLVTFL